MTSEAPSDTTAGQDQAKGYIAAQLTELREERERLQARLDGLSERERVLWADARRAGVSFGKIAAVSGLDRTTVFYALNPRGKAKGDDDG